MERNTTWEWTKRAVEMIPFGLLAGFYGEKEIRITKLAEEGFCFRLCTASEITKLQEKLKLCFYNIKQNQYQEVTLLPDTWKVEARTKFFTSYAVTVQREDYRIAVRTLLMQYDRYIRLKLEEDDSGLAEQMTRYPAGEDEVFAESFQEQMEEWFGTETKGVPDGTGLERRQPRPELAWELDHSYGYTQFLKQRLDEFLKDYLKCYPAFQDWFQGRKLDRLYIGNAFCHLLFPDKAVLFELIEKAKRESLQVTLTFSYVREYQLEQTEKLLEELEQWCRETGMKLEIEINDWAMADMLKNNFSNLFPCYGRMLNKRKKDPRMTYKKGRVELLRENSLNAEFYREYLEQEFGIHRFEWESCGYEQQFPENRMNPQKKTMNLSGEMVDLAEKATVENHLHLPFYQTNTSQYCTLYAGSVYGDRSRQRLVTACDMRCEQENYLYPRHLRMVGRYNSLFGEDPRILEQTGIMPSDPKKTREFCSRNHIGRLVLPYWM